MDDKDKLELEAYRRQAQRKAKQNKLLMANSCAKCDDATKPIAVKVTEICRAIGGCGCTGMCKTVGYCYDCARPALDSLGHDSEQANMKGITLW